MLNEGWRLNGYASDDSHHLDHDCLGGWVQVKCEALDPVLLLEALKAGRYYSSQGPGIDDISLAGDEVHIACSPATTIVLSGRGSRATAVRGNDLTEATVSIERFRGAYFRVTVVDTEGRKAWSNPVWLD